MKKAWFVSFIRFPLLILGLMFMFLILWMLGIGFHFPFLPELSTIYFTVINIISFLILNSILKNEGHSIKELVDFRKALIKKDILYGLLWLVVLYIPFLVAVIFVMFIMYGADFINHFEIVFAGDMQSHNFFRPSWLLWMGAIFSVIFPFINAPIEELMYKGYAQQKFILRYKKVWIGILIPSIGFSLQHIMLAASIQGAIVYAFAFFLWGIVSGIIYLKQKRLLPLIICHFIVNLVFGIIPLIFMITGTN